jgi:hypothetical protein
MLREIQDCVVRFYLASRIAKIPVNAAGLSQT